MGVTVDMVGVELVLTGVLVVVFGGVVVFGV